MNAESRQRSAIVIGAGWAGLSAAVELADRGWRVRVLEQSKRLGGRASSFTDPKTGDIIDNGQHLLMGCYARTLDFLRKIGTIDRVRFQSDLSVDFVRPGGKLSTLRARPLPAPLHLLSGVWGLDTLSLGEKLAMARVYRALKNGYAGKTRGLTADQWLESLGQSARARRYFWEPITLATLNEQASVAEASSLAIVLKEAFFSSKEKSQIVISTVGLSDLCAPAAQFIESRGGSVRNNELVSRIEVADGRVQGVRVRDGELLTADLYVSAVPFFVLENILASANDPFFSRMKRLETSPIFSITLWFDRGVTDREFVGLLDTEVQWLFNRRRVTGSERSDGHVTCVISGARKFLDWTNEDLLKLCLDELRSCFPRAREAKLQAHLIQREKNATLSPKIGSDQYRLPQKTPLANFLLCGDWTDTGLPATIEGAVLSGVKAVEQISVR